jgi:hypothetical protein
MRGYDFSLLSPMFPSRTRHARPLAEDAVDCPESQKWPARG